jgi:hypothetical protein
MLPATVVDIAHTDGRVTLEYWHPREGEWISFTGAECDYIEGAEFLMIEEVRRDSVTLVIEGERVPLSLQSGQDSLPTADAR